MSWDESTRSGTVARRLHDERFAEQIDNNGLAQFVRALRSYVIHRDLPVISRVTTFDGAGVVDRVVSLDVGELRASDYNWKAAREYLETMPPTVPLSVIVQDFTGLMIEFFGWHAREREKHHAVALQEAAALQDELERASAAMRSATDNEA